MGTIAVIYIYGLCTMFYGMMTWFFGRRKDRLSKFVALLMCTICMGYMKDLFFFSDNLYQDEFYWMLLTSVDMVAVPMYAFILMELVRPGMVTKRLALFHELPFLLLPLLFVSLHQPLFFYILAGWVALYGTFVLVWTTCQIPVYHRQLREHFSYKENINLNWLRVVLYTFYLILGLWVLNCTAVHLQIECLYMLGALVLWMIIDYFLYKHESVIDELREAPSAELSETAAGSAEMEISELGKKINQLFGEQQLFLNPHLKVSDVARAVGTNRTYVSAYFNRDAGMSFYDYVNRLRIDYSCHLLETTTESIKNIAESSGFNSATSYIRVFTKQKGVTPNAYRNKG